MQIPLKSPHARKWRRLIPAFVGLALLAGCGTQGDFGEVNPILVRDDIHDWLGRDGIARPLSFLTDSYLTDDERQLRDLAYPLIEPPYMRQQWYSVASEYGVTGVDRLGFDRTAYARCLMSKYFRSASSRYSQLIDDIRNDTTRLSQFFETAARVLDIDQKRRKSLTYVSELSKLEYDNALSRIRENALIVSRVRTKLDQRVTAYRFALERLVILTPTTQAVEAERSLNQLQAQIVYYHNHKAPTWAREQSLAVSR